jgi:hypothetical protein
MLAPSGIKRRPQGLGAGSLGQAANPLPELAGTPSQFAGKFAASFQISRRELQKVVGRFTIEL